METEIDVIGTDHCPFTLEDKKRGGDDFTKIPFGLPGLENSLELMLTEAWSKRGIDIENIYAMQSLNPSKIFGLYPKKGTLMPGSDADIVVIDPKCDKKIKRSEVISAAGWSPYEGWDLHSSVSITISRGEIVFQNGEFSGKKGRGQFIKRSPSSYYCSSQ